VEQGCAWLVAEGGEDRLGLPVVPGFVLGSGGHEVQPGLQLGGSVCQERSELVDRGEDGGPVQQHSRVGGDSGAAVVPFEADQ
jgi:hypothetical protein